MNEARSQYNRDNSSNHKKLFAAGEHSFGSMKKNTVLPPCDDKLALAERMRSYFVNKIPHIGTILDVRDSFLNSTLSPTPKFSKFMALSILEVRKLIEGSPKKGRQ